MAKSKPQPAPEAEAPEAPPEAEAPEVQEQDAGTKTLNIHQRMFHAASLISVLVKRDKNAHQGYKYVSHDDVVAKVRQAFQACGILAIMDVPGYEMETYENNNKLNFMAKISATMTFVNIDAPGDSYRVNIPAYALDTSDKALGKAISYAKKYALIALSGLMLATGDDVDQDFHELEALATARAQTKQGEPVSMPAAKDAQPKDAPPPQREGPPAQPDPEKARQFLAGFKPEFYAKQDNGVLTMIIGAHGVVGGSKDRHYGEAVVAENFGVSPSDVDHDLLAKIAVQCYSKNVAMKKIRALAVRDFGEDAEEFLWKLGAARGWRPVVTDNEDGGLEAEALAWEQDGAPKLA